MTGESLTNKNLYNFILNDDYAELKTRLSNLDADKLKKFLQYQSEEDNDCTVLHVLFEEGNTDLIKIIANKLSVTELKAVLSIQNLGGINPIGTLGNIAEDNKAATFSKIIEVFANNNEQKKAVLLSTGYDKETLLHTLVEEYNEGLLDKVLEEAKKANCFLDILKAKDEYNKNPIENAIVKNKTEFLGKTLNYLADLQIEEINTAKTAEDLQQKYNAEKTKEEDIYDKEKLQNLLKTTLKEKLKNAVKTKAKEIVTDNVCPADYSNVKNPFAAAKTCKETIEKLEEIEFLKNKFNTKKETAKAYITKATTRTDDDVKKGLSALFGHAKGLYVEKQRKELKKKESELTDKKNKLITKVENKGLGLGTPGKTEEEATAIVNKIEKLIWNGEISISDSTTNYPEDTATDVLAAFNNYTTQSKQFIEAVNAIKSDILAARKKIIDVKSGTDKEIGVDRKVKILESSRFDSDADKKMIEQIKNAEKDSYLCLSKGNLKIKEIKGEDDICVLKNNLNYFQTYNQNALGRESKLQKFFESINSDKYQTENTFNTQQTLRAACAYLKPESDTCSLTSLNTIKKTVCQEASNKSLTNHEDYKFLCEDTNGITDWTTLSGDSLDTFTTTP